MKLGVISDAHGNIGGFDAACRILADAKVDRLIYLGDAVGYIPDVMVVRRLIESKLTWIAGNHEVMLLEEEPETSDAYRLQALKAKLSTREMDFIRALPRSLSLELDGTRCLFVHGSPNDPTYGYVYHDTELATVGGADHDVVFMGHTHRPFVRSYCNTTFVNVGSCGLPRDASARGSACLFDTISREARLMSFSLAVAARHAISNFDIAPAVRRTLERSVETQ